MANRGKSILWAIIILALGSILKSQATNVQADAVKNLVVHYVNADVNPANSSYNVAVYFSILDAASNPVKDLQTSYFTVSEDGNQMTTDSLLPAENEPMNVVLVLDTSGSMWYNVNAARTAAGHFIDSLNTSDQVAILTFDTNVQTLSDFTTDKTAARKQVDLIQANPNSGTCLYDAVYKAVQLTASLPSGRRAIVLMTDGKDSINGNNPCSTYTSDDVINLASQGVTRAPVFTIGLGDSADASALKRMSALTGGRYQFAPYASKLDAMYLLLSSQLRLQYVLHYTSTSTPGAHVLILKVNYQNIQDQDNRNFVLPASPYGLSFLSPSEGQDVTGKTNITVSVSGQGPTIKQVEFLVNGASIGSDDTPPYEMEWEPTANLSGDVPIMAVAQDENNNELARSSITVKVVLSAALTHTENSTVTPAGIFSSLSGTTLGILIIAGVIILIVIIVVVIVIGIYLRQRTINKERDRQWQAAVNPPGSSATTDKTMDGFLPSANALGILMVLQSDDPAVIGQRIEITQPITNIGRSADNDILFPKDSPVSRRHAVIEERSGQLILSESLSDSGDGKIKRPTFGTFVNNKQVEDAVPLRNGDEIRLGKRVRMQFEAVDSGHKDEERTIDQGPSSEDKTIDQGG